MRLAACGFNGWSTSSITFYREGLSQIVPSFSSLTFILLFNGLPLFQGPTQNPQAVACEQACSARNFPCFLKRYWVHFSWPLRHDSNLSTLMTAIRKIVFQFTLAGLAIPGIAHASPSLYDRLGGLENIRKIVGQTIDRTSRDPRAEALFEGIRLDPVKESVTTHLCEITGGPCTYDGASMKKAHSGMDISSDQFDLMDAYLGQALVDHGVKDADRKDLGKLLQPFKTEIVGK